APARGRPGVRPFRPRRLGGLEPRDRRDGRHARHRHARPGATARAVAARARPRGVCDGDAVRGGAGRGDMRRFAALFDRLDASTSTRAKTAALAEYFAAADPADAAWAAYFLTGHRPRQAVPSK